MDCWFGKTIHFTWIRGYQYDPHNRVDLLSKTARDLPTITWHKRPFQELLARVRKKVFATWTVSLQNYLDTRHTRYSKFVYTVPSSPWFHNFILPRKYITMLGRARIGHCRLRDHLYKIHIVHSPLCGCLQQRETLDHLLMDCPRTLTFRTDFYDHLYKTKLHKPISAINLIYHPTAKFIILFYHFLISIDVDL